MTNAERIIALLSKSPGLDDDELSSHTNIKPRQQINQICRRLQSEGILQRLRGPNGKIINLLTSAKPLKTPANSVKVSMPHRRHAVTGNPQVFKELAALDLRKTLIVLPCSGRKKHYVESLPTGGAVTDLLDSTLASRLSAARRSVGNEANLDDRVTVPAWSCYDGTLYRTAATTLRKMTTAKLPFVILSGGYGIVLGDEPIGIYEKVFQKADWPKGLLEQVLITLLAKLKIKSLVAFVADSTAYRGLLDSTDWKSTSLENVFLISPERGTGAMVKAPRAQGQALNAFVQGTLDESFLSSDGLGLVVTKIYC